MKHKTTSRFRECFEALPPQIQQSANKSFLLLKENPAHPSLKLKKVGNLWSIRIGIRYRALAIKQPECFIWVWIGSHDDYINLIRNS